MRPQPRPFLPDPGRTDPGARWYDYAIISVPVALLVFCIVMAIRTAI